MAQEPEKNIPCKKISHWNEAENDNLFVPNNCSTAESLKLSRVRNTGNGYDPLRRYIDFDILMLVYWCWYIDFDILMIDIGILMLVYWCWYIVFGISILIYCHWYIDIDLDILSSIYWYMVRWITSTLAKAMILSA